MLLLLINQFVTISAGNIWSDTVFALESHSALLVQMSQFNKTPVLRSIFYLLF